MTHSSIRTSDEILSLCRTDDALYRLVSESMTLMAMWSPWWSTLMRASDIRFSDRDDFSCVGVAPHTVVASRAYVARSTHLQRAQAIEYAFYQIAHRAHIRGDMLAQSLPQSRKSLAYLAVHLEIVSGQDVTYEKIVRRDWDLLVSQTWDASMIERYGLASMPEIDDNVWTPRKLGFPDLLSARDYLDLLVARDREEEQQWLNDHDPNSSPLEDSPTPSQSPTGQEPGDSSASGSQGPGDSPDSEATQDSGDGPTSEENQGLGDDSTPEAGQGSGDSPDSGESQGSDNDATSGSQGPGDSPYSEARQGSGNDSTSGNHNLGEGSASGSQGQGDDSTPSSQGPSGSQGLGDDSAGEAGQGIGDGSTSRAGQGPDDDPTSGESQGLGGDPATHDGASTLGAISDIFGSSDTQELTCPPSLRDDRYEPLSMRIDAGDKKALLPCQLEDLGVEERPDDDNAFDQQEYDDLLRDLAKNIDDFEHNRVPTIPNTAEGFSQWARTTLGRPKGSWKKIFRRIMGPIMSHGIMTGMEDQSYSKQNPNQQPNMPIMMGSISHPPKVAVLMDASGSMRTHHAEALTQFAGVLQTTFSSFEVPVTIIVADGPIRDIISTSAVRNKVISLVSRTYRGNSAEFGETLRRVATKGPTWKGRTFPKPDILLVITDCLFLFPWEDQSRPPSKCGSIVIVSMTPFDALDGIRPPWVKNNKNFVYIPGKKKELKHGR